MALTTNNVNGTPPPPRRGRHFDPAAHEHEGANIVPRSAPPVNIVMLVVLRKMLFLHPQEKHPVITVMKDVIAGTAVGLFVLLFLIFLDYRNIVPLQSARGLRQASLELLLTDPETVASIEEATERTFVPMEVYDGMTSEISRHRTAIAEMIENGLSKYEPELEAIQKAIEPIRQEHTEWQVKFDKLVGLDRWCGSCSAGWGNCDGRVAFIIQKYGDSERKAKIDILERGKCIKVR